MTKSVSTHICPHGESKGHEWRIILINGRPDDGADEEGGKADSRVWRLKGQLFESMVRKKEDEKNPFNCQKTETNMSTECRDNELIRDERIQSTHTPTHTLVSGVEMNWKSGPILLLSKSIPVASCAVLGVRRRLRSSRTDSNFANLLRSNWIRWSWWWSSPHARTHARTHNSHFGIVHCLKREDIAHVHHLFRSKADQRKWFLLFRAEVSAAFFFFNCQWIGKSSIGRSVSYAKNAKNGSKTQSSSKKRVKYFFSEMMSTRQGNWQGNGLKREYDLCSTNFRQTQTSRVGPPVTSPVYAIS